VIRHIDRLSSIIAAVLMFLITVAMTLQIVSRYVFNNPIDWTEEVSKILFIAMIFIGAIAAEHIKVTAFINTLNFKSRRLIDRTNNLIETFYFGFVIYLFLIYLSPARSISTSILEINYYYLYAIVAITFSFLSLKNYLVTWRSS